MDDIVTVSRIEKGTPLTYEEQDANTANLRTGIEQAYAESFKYTDAAELDDLVSVIQDEDRLILVNSLFDSGEAVGPGNMPFVEIEWLDILAAVLGEIPDGPGTPEEIRDALESLTGANRLDASAIKNLPTLTPGDPVTITHDGAGDDPVVGDTLTAEFAAGWAAPVQWTRDGTPIGGATSGTYVAVEDDEDTTVGAIIGDTDGLHFIATGLDVVPPSETVPDAFEAGDWTATAIAGGVAIDIVALPADGGSAITALQYRIDGGSPVAFAGTGTGVRNITGLTGGVEVDVEIRAVNAIGSGAWSDVKARTPAASADPEWLAPGAIYSTVSSLTTHDIPVPTGLEAGDWLLMPNWEFGTISSVVADNGQALSLLATGGLGDIWGVQLAGTMPTEIVVTLSSPNDFTAQAFAGRGVSAVGGVVNDANSLGEPRTEISYEADATKSLVLSLIGGNSTGVIDTATFNEGLAGEVPASILSRWEFTNYNVVLGVHDGTTGAKTYAVTWDPADSGTGGSWNSVELIP